MKGLLVRIGIDQTYGGWNAPVDPDTREFVFVPIPGRRQREGLETLCTDFRHLAYGDTGERRGRSLADLDAGDFIAFYSGLRPTRAWPDPQLYALIGLYRVRECARVPDIAPSRWHENAHTRR